MKVDKTETKTYVLTELDCLDPVTVYVDESKIIIECYAQSWCAFWGGMKSTIQEFFLSCNNDYILDRLLAETMQTDFDKITELAKKKDFNIYATSDAEIAMQQNDMSDCFGDEWYMDLPTCHTSDYQYVSRIIDAIKAAFSEEIKLQKS